MAKYHVSEDGKPRVCNASSPEKCTARGADGESAPHGDFANSRDARTFAEQVLEKTMGGDNLSGSSKKSFSAVSDERIVNAGTKRPVSPLPDLMSVYEETPKTNIGVSRVYGHLKGIQKDIDSGRINDSEARSRISVVVEQLKVLEDYNDTATRPEAIAYRKKLEELTDGAPAAKTLSEKDHWKQVQADLDSFENNSRLSSKQSFELNKVRDALRGATFSHDGYSEIRALKLSEDLNSSLAQARKPEAKALAASIRDALEVEKKD